MIINSLIYIRKYYPIKITAPDFSSYQIITRGFKTKNNRIWSSALMEKRMDIQNKLTISNLL
ncbi:MAG: hypothetical protein AB1394_03085, partial [Bacteroidota bacterium]